MATLRSKWQTFQKDGFETLAPKPRSDRSQSRKHQPEWIERAVELKKEPPSRSDETINRFLQAEFGQQRDVLDRISVRYHLHPLSKSQTAAYLDFHVQIAGGQEAIFDPPVKDRIHDYTGGVPRQINNLATACLLQAAVQNAARVDESLLQQTLSEFHLP